MMTLMQVSSFIIALSVSDFIPFLLYTFPYSSYLFLSAACLPLLVDEDSNCVRIAKLITEPHSLCQLSTALHNLLSPTMSLIAAIVYSFILLLML